VKAPRGFTAQASRIGSERKRGAVSPEEVGAEDTTKGDEEAVPMVGCSHAAIGKNNKKTRKDSGGAGEREGEKGRKPSHRMGFSRISRAILLGTHDKREKRIVQLDLSLAD